jgi:RNase P/RNase MRP subunit p29
MKMLYFFYCNFSHNFISKLKNIKMVKLLFSIPILLLVFTASAQDRILKTDGTVIKGKVVSFQNNRLVVLQEDETEMTLPRKAVSEIKFDYQETGREPLKMTPKSVEQPVQVAAPALIRVPTPYSTAPATPKQEPAQQPILKNNTIYNTTVASPGEVVGLEERTLISSPALKEKALGAGRVAVAVCLNTEGGVASAKFKAVGSSTIDADLISLAVQNAREFKFSKGNGGDCGVIVYKFNME